MQAAKLGLVEVGADSRTTSERQGDETLVEALLETLTLVETDMTLFYRRLAELPVEGATSLTDEALLSSLEEAYYDPGALSADARAATVGWLRRYVDRVGRRACPIPGGGSA